MNRVAGFLFSKVRETHRRAKVHLGPIIEERRRMYEKYGDDWPDKPVGGIYDSLSARLILIVRQTC